VHDTTRFAMLVLFASAAFAQDDLEQRVAGKSAGCGA
jgi:hypothetical protein